jgi:hypothetical protein
MSALLREDWLGFARTTLRVTSRGSQFLPTCRSARRAESSTMADRIRIIPHYPEGIPDCGSFEVRFADGRESQWFYWDNNPGQASITRKRDQEQARARQPGSLPGQSSKNFSATQTRAWLATTATGPPLPKGLSLMIKARHPAKGIWAGGGWQGPCMPASGSRPAQESNAGKSDSSY